MKPPPAPPTWEKPVPRLARERLAKIALLGPGAARDDLYLDWDELQHRTPPAGLTREEWWMALRLGRNLSARPIPLRRDANTPFVFNLPGRLLAQLHDLDRNRDGGGVFPGIVAHRETRDRYAVRSLVHEAIASSQLAGAAIPHEVAKEMLRTGRAPRDRTERMIANTHAALGQVSRLRESSLTPELVLEIQRVMTEGTVLPADAAGRLRRADEPARCEDQRAGASSAPPLANDPPARLDALCEFANGRTPDFFVPPPVRAILLHFWLRHEQPFVQGNGRVARALFYWSMLRHDYRLFELLSISEILVAGPQPYAMAFVQARPDENDLTYFILHQATAIAEAVAALREHAARRSDGLRASREKLRALAGLNHRQQILLAHALREPGTEYVIEGHRRTHAVTFQTARDDLFDLVAQGWLNVTKEGRQNVFRAPADLGQKLGKPEPKAVTAPTVAEDPSLPMNLR